MKKLIRIFLICIFTMSLSITSLAAMNVDDPNDYSWETEGLEGSPSTERWSYIANTSQGMSIDKNGKAILDASLTGYYGTTKKVIIYMYLQKYYDGYWHNLTWTKDEFNDFYGMVERYKTGCTSGTYRLKVSYYAYGPNNKYENHVAYSATYYY